MRGLWASQVHFKRRADERFAFEVDKPDIEIRRRKRRRK